jgi:hypothetical protein
MGIKYVSFWYESYSEQSISQTGLFTYWIPKLLPPFGEEPFVETVFSKVVIEADIPRRDAVVQAFKVGDIFSSIFHSSSQHSNTSMRGTRMVCPNGLS